MRETLRDILKMLAFIGCLVAAIAIGRAFIAKTAVPYRVSSVDIAQIVNCMKARTCANTTPKEQQPADPSEGVEATPPNLSNRVSENFTFFEVSFFDGDTRYDLIWNDFGDRPDSLGIRTKLNLPDGQRIFFAWLTDCKGDGIIDEGIEEVPEIPVHARKHFRAPNNGCSTPGLGDEYQEYMQRMYYNSIAAAKRRLLK